MDIELISILIISYSFLAIMLAIDIFFIIRHLKKTKKQKIELNAESENIALNKETILYEKINDLNKIIEINKLINDAIYIKKNKETFKSSKILVNNYGLFIIKEFNDDADFIEGDFNRREWIIKLTNKEYYIHNLFLELDLNIKNLLPLLPNNLPVMGLLIFNSIKEFKLLNYPQYLTYLNIDDLYNFMYEIRFKLKPVLSKTNVEQINELMNTKVFKS